MRKPFKKKIVYDLSNDDYHNSPEWSAAISSTALKTAFGDSLFHMNFGKSSIADAVAREGTGLHYATLEPEKNMVFRRPTNSRTNAGKADIAALEAEGKVLLTDVEYDRVKRMAANLRAHPICGMILAEKDRVVEASLMAKHKPTGLLVRCRPDIYIPSTGVMADVKSCQSSNPHKFQRTAWNYLWPLQAAFYKMVAEECGWTVKNFHFLSAEKTPAAAAHCHHMGDEAMEWATKAVNETLQKIADAKASNQWPTGWGEYSEITLANWLEN